MSLSEISIEKFLSTDTLELVGEHEVTEETMSDNDPLSEFSFTTLIYYMITF